MTFSELNISKPLLNALHDLGFTQPTVIQEMAYATIMSGKDVLGIAQTGTGKTFAYLLPCLRQWQFTKEKFPQILILVPTRELVVQVVAEVEKLTQYMNFRYSGVYGGVNIKPQIDAINGGLDLIVATPGRLLELVVNGTLKLKSIRKFVIDEVDELLSLGFQPQLTHIIDLLQKRQNLLFSATITEEVEKFIDANFTSPVKIEAAPTGTPLASIIQKGYDVPNFHTKVNLLEYLLRHDNEMTKVLVFTSTKLMADMVFERMESHFPEAIGVIHSNKAQKYRFNTVTKFHEGLNRVLISTDVMARGLDIYEVTHVINFDTPDEPESYLHRIGRTGRADKNGISITFTTPAEKEFRDSIEELMKYKIPTIELPEDLEISDILLPEEMPKVKMKNIKVKLPKKELAGPAFHEKKEKNKKTNSKVPHKKLMHEKYGKPQRRGTKPKR